MRQHIDRKISIEWLIDKFWPLLWMIFGGSITATSLGIVAEFDKYTPIALLCAFIIGALIFIAFYILLNKARAQRISIRLAEQAASNTMVNPLESRFDNKTIKLSEFYDPFYVGHKSKTFTNCRVEGPGLLMLQGCTVHGGGIINCQILIVQEDIKISGVTILYDSTISGGTICNCTLLMTRSQYNHQTSFHGNVPVISESIST